MSRYEGLTVLDYGVAPVAGEATYAAGLATVAAADAAVKLVAVTTKKGASNGLTVGTDNTFTLVTNTRKLLRIQGRFHVDLASAADALTLHIFVNGVTVFETAAQTVTSGTPKLYEFDQFLSVDPGTVDAPNAGVIEIYAENEDTTANIDTVAFAGTVGIVSATAATDTTVLTHGWVKISG